MRSSLPRAGRCLAALSLLTALAACNAGRNAAATLDGYTPDPALKTAPVSNLRTRVSHACVITQARFQRAPEASVEQPCGCYAERTLRSLNRDEIQSYRATGYFNDTAKAKALDALDACRLPRPV